MPMTASKLCTTCFWYRAPKVPNDGKHVSYFRCRNKKNAWLVVPEGGASYGDPGNYWLGNYPPDDVGFGCIHWEDERKQDDNV